MVWAGKTPNQGTKVQKSRHRAPHPGGERGGAVKIPNTKLGPKCKTGQANQSAGRQAPSIGTKKAKWGAKCKREDEASFGVEKCSTVKS